MQVSILEQYMNKYVARAHSGYRAVRIDQFPFPVQYYPTFWDWQQ